MFFWNSLAFSNSQGTQPFIYMYLFSPKLPSHPGCHITSSRVPCSTLQDPHSTFKSAVFSQSMYHILHFSKEYLPSSYGKQVCIPALIHVNKDNKNKWRAALLAFPFLEEVWFWPEVVSGTRHYNPLSEDTWVQAQNGDVLNWSCSDFYKACKSCRCIFG